MGLRSLLNRQAVAEQPAQPLARLAELGRADTPTPTGVRAFAPLTTQADAAPVSDVGLDKKPELVELESQKKAELRRVPSYIWRSRASRERRSQAVDFGNTRF